VNVEVGSPRVFGGLKVAYYQIPALVLLKKMNNIILKTIFYGYIFGGLAATHSCSNVLQL
jgi:hypothetical protein